MPASSGLSVGNGCPRHWRTLPEPVSYPNTPTEKLTEEERQTISTLSSIAAGIAGGIAGGNTAGAAAGASAGKNAVENNALNPNDFGKGMADIGMSQTSLGASMLQSGASPDEITAALVKNAQGQTPEGQDPVKGLLSAWGNFFGVPLDVVLSNEQMTPQKAAEIISSGVPTSEAKLMQYVAAKAFFYRRDKHRSWLICFQSKVC
ncbi:VENN motif pre-toxin domain-containing protein [Salmonella enterica]|uniref:VENN motif-containing domain-containing protein n=1 Tax=Salmonella enterica subsp. enterica serovar Pensacola TaxID=34042 RepID=A0A602ZA04_SALET|nr:hypothetical protein [Salmonella enterica subsp. enterica serovar Pensacola]EAQ4576391.1 hypothetical protein [Salmonella enterica]EDQ0314978.1 hypothetical protein [Salmonella enterica subsp. enterica serovar Berta]EDV7396650.1 hypothetical protein [Salmonella enterica subsp. enterica]EAV2408096.1 hypothetical protein [Salmonella enterica]